MYKRSSVLCARQTSPTFVVMMVALFCVLFINPSFVCAQKASSLDRGRGHQMLQTVKSDIEKHYYDVTFRNINLDARFKRADDAIKTADSNSQIFGIIAQVLLEFNDSHLFFRPPSRSTRTEYGWQGQMIGDVAYVSAVKPKSDAEAKGLKVGDHLISVDGINLTRGNFWVFQYLYHSLRPKAGMRLVVQSLGEQPRQLEVLAKMQEGKRVVDIASGRDIYDLIRQGEEENRLHRHRFVTHPGNSLIIWKMPQFDLEEAQVDEMMSRVKKYPAVILDLRGNGGGYIMTLQRLVGNFFDREIKIGDLKGRKEMKPMIAKSRGREAYGGKLIVLIDSRSGSSSELFARVVQLERRGTVIGDHSAGAVMRSRHYPHQLGTDTVVFYGVSITNADVIMIDGKSLEHTGVIPDKTMLPTGTDLAAGRDPVLAHAAALLGVELDSQKAGSFFPIEWRK